MARWRRLSTMAWFTLILGSLGVLLITSAMLTAWALTGTTRNAEQVTRRVVPELLAFHTETRNRG